MSSKICPFLFLVLVFLSMAVADNTLSQTVSTKQLFSETAKVWHNFLRTFLHRTLSQREKAMFESNPRMEYRSQNSVALTFVKNARKVTPDKLFNSTDSQKRDALVTKPSGAFQHNVSHHFAADSCTHPQSVLETPSSFCVGLFSNDHHFRGKRSGWELVLHKQLSLNISFNYINIPVRTVTSCYHGSLSIGDWVPFTMSLRNKDIELGACMELGKSTSFVFCGWHSSFNLYTSYSNTYIGLCLEKYTNFFQDAFYQVKDRDLVISRLVNTGAQNFPVPKSVYVVGKRNLKIFYISISKLCKISVLVFITKTSKIRVFDGPDHSVPSATIEIMKGVRYLYLASSFQCTVHLLTWGVTEHTQLHSNEYFMYLSRSLHFVNKDMSLDGHPAIVSVPGIECPNTPCAILFKNKHTQRINVTLSEIEFHGPNTLTCTHAGVASFEHISGTFRETDSFCLSPEETAGGKGRSFYSKKTEMALAIYWLRQYGEQTVTLTAFWTACSIIHVDPCFVSTFCTMCGQTKVCNKLWQKLANSTSVALRKMAGDYSNRNQAQLRFEVREDNCTLLHITQGRKFFGTRAPYHRLTDFFEFCSVHFAAGNMLSPQKTMHIQVRGKLASATPNCFKVWEHKTPHCTGNQTWSHCFDESISLSINKRSYELQLEAKIPTPVHEGSFRLNKISFMGKSQAWFDVMLWMSNSAEQTFQSQELLLPHKQISFIDISQQSSNHYLVLCLKALKTGHELLGESTISLNWNRFSSVRIEGLDYHRRSVMETLRAGVYPSFHKLSLSITQLFRFPQTCRAYSLPGELLSLNISSSKEKQTFNLTAQWIDDKYQAQLGWSVHSGDQCNGTTTAFRNHSCLKFSILKKDVRKNVVLFGKRLYLNSTEITDVSSELRTWNEARELCISVKSSLPVFSSTEEVDEIVALLKLFSTFPYISHLYTGLVFNKSNQVTFPYFFHLIPLACVSAGLV